MVSVERGFLGFLLLLGVLGLIGSLNLDLMSREGAPGPGLWPLLLSIILIFLSAGSIITSKMKGKENSQPFFIREYLPKQILFIIILIISFLLINVVGMLISIGLLAFVTLLKIEGKSWMNSLVSSVLSVLVMYLIFDYWLGLTLPTGSFLS